MGGGDERRKERARRSGGRVRERGKTWQGHGGGGTGRCGKEVKTKDAMTDVIGRRGKK